jgi:hypothetical protein
MNDKINKTELLKVILNRYDLYLNAVNAKGRFVIALFTFVGALLIYHSEIILNICPDYLFWLCIALLTIGIAICFSGIFFVIKAVFPFLSSGNSSKDDYHSLIYFGAVSEFDSGGEYHQKVQSRSAEQDEKDIAYQVFQLSKGLEEKYEAIKYAMYHLYALGITLIILIIIKIIGEII